MHRVNLAIIDISKYISRIIFLTIILVAAYYPICAAELSQVTLTTNPLNTAQIGMPVTLTASATGGTNLQYKFMTGTSLMRSFNSSNTLTFTPTVVKTYNLTVVVRDLNGVDPNATVISPIVSFTIINIPLTAVSLTTSPLNSVVINTPVTLTAIATGGTNIQYKFMAGTSLMRSFNNTNSLTFTPTVAKTYNFTVIARDLSGIDPNATVTSTIVNLTITNPPLTTVSMTTSPLNTAFINTPVTLTAAATGGGNIQYKYMAGASLLRSFNNSNTMTFTPTVLKTYNITVIARDLNGVDPNATVTSAISSITIVNKPAPPQGDNLLETMTVDGFTRTALVSTGHSDNPPLLLVFHGFGGYASSMESLTKFHQLWPEATVVYPQGLDVVKPSIQYWAPGWPDYPDEYKTADAINQYHDRDIHFIDALLTLMRNKYQIDQNHVYATGFSNGATFSYLLYTLRPGIFNAFAGLAGPATFLNYAFTSRPVLTINGTNDAYVPADLAASMKAEFMRVNQCSSTSASWQFNSAYSIYNPAVPSGEPLVWYQPNSGHTWISGASEAMIAFFKAH
ncbi:MAG: hypothetical protein WCO98_01490 [bacterium]